MSGGAFSRASFIFAGGIILLGMNKLSAIPSRPSRMSAKLRRAVNLHVCEGMTIVAACDKAGMSPQGYHKAMKRATVRDHLEEVQRLFILSADTKKALYRARALEGALDLMLNSKSEAIRARMCEFLASDAKISPVAVHIDARQDRGGYEFVRPGQRIVEISQATGEGDAAAACKTDDT